MSAKARNFVGLAPSREKWPHNPNDEAYAFENLIKDQFSLPVWLSFGATIEGLLFLVVGRLALLPALAFVLYHFFNAYMIATGWKRNRLMEDVIMKKASAQFPGPEGQFGNKPADDEIAVILIGIRSNHPMGVFAPGVQHLGAYKMQMDKDLEAHADEFGFLGMTNWTSAGTAPGNADLMAVCYFRNWKGLEDFAHSEYHREAWKWFNKTYKEHPYITLWHETFHVPKGHWENVYINGRPTGMGATAHKVFDQETGQDVWASPLVDVSKGAIKTSGGRMARSKGDEHDSYEEDPYQKQEKS